MGELSSARKEVYNYLITIKDKMRMAKDSVKPTAARILIGSHMMAFALGGVHILIASLLPRITGSEGLALVVAFGLFGIWINLLTNRIVPNLCQDLVLRDDESV